MQRLKNISQAICSLLLLPALLCHLFMVSPAKAAYSRFDNSKFSMLVIDGYTGTVLFQENAGKYRYPASLTKMMTLYLVFEALERGKLQMGKMLTVSTHAAAQAPSKLYLAAGSKVSVQDAVMAVVIKSANDAAVVLAEALGGSEYDFALMMTRKARSLGMNHTMFRNASGLPNLEQKTTAYDLARLAMALYRDHPKYYYLFSQSTYQYKRQKLYTHNRVTARYRGADGIKTGFINASGFNLVTSAGRNGKRLIGVVLGGRTAAGRDQYMIEILDKGFRKLAQGKQIKQAANIPPSPIMRDPFIQANTKTPLPSPPGELEPEVHPLPTPRNVGVPAPIKKPRR